MKELLIKFFRPVLLSITWLIYQLENIYQRIVHNICELSSNKTTDDECVDKWGNNSQVIEFQPDPQAKDKLEKLGIASIFEDIRPMANNALILDNELSECCHFEFLRRDNISELINRDEILGSKWFWKQVNQLIIFTGRSCSHTINKLIDGLQTSIASGNDLTLALITRSFMEQVSSIYHLDCILDKHKERLGKLAWPDSYTIQPTAEDESLRKELVVFILGKRYNPFIDIMSYNLYDKKLWETHEKEASIQDKDEFRSKGIMNYIDKVKDKEGLPFWRSFYDMLCEFCHPNSDSRTFDYSSALGSTGHHFYGIQNYSDYFLSNKRIYLSMTIIVKHGSHIVIRFLDTLRSCLPSILPLNSREIDHIPQIHQTKGIDFFGRSIWVNANNIKSTNNVPAKLTDDQLQRIKVINQCFSDAGGPKLDKQIHGISTDAFPEEEILLWEDMMRVYKEELSQRPMCRFEERNLLMLALVQSTIVKNVGELLSTIPKLKKLKHLERIFNRIRNQVK